MPDTPMTPERLAEVRALLRMTETSAELAQGWDMQVYHQVKQSLTNARELAAEVERQRAELAAIAEEIARFGIYGPVRAAAVALVRRADELVTENASLRAELSARPTRAGVLCEAADEADSLRQFKKTTGPRWSAQVSENVGILRVSERLREVADAADPYSVIKTVITDFGWGNYGLDEVAMADSEWVGDLASAIAGALPDADDEPEAGGPDA